MTNQQFHLGDLLSLTTERLMPPNGIDGVTRLLNHMAGDTLMIHQLPLAAEAMLPELLQQHPWLKDLVPPKGCDLPDLVAWFDWTVAGRGEHHDVEPAPLAWGTHDPIADLLNARAAQRRTAADSFVGLGNAFTEAAAAAERFSEVIARVGRQRPTLKDRARGWFTRWFR